MKWPVPTDWPHSDVSQRIFNPPHRWHVQHMGQQMGQGPVALLLHGAGGSTHSFAGLMPLLADRFTVVAIDLPGHGFTQLGARHRSGLPPMAEDIAALCQKQGWKPDIIIGHSAGCALALEICDTILSPRGQVPKVIGINAALSTFEGIAGVLFPAMAKALAALPFTAKVFSELAGKQARVQSLIGGTGSNLTPDQIDLYTRLISDRDHVDGALLMMSQWSLDALLGRLHSISTQTLLVAGAQDKTVPATVSTNAAHALPCARSMVLEGLGHLAHEEDPNQVFRPIIDFVDQSAS
ncbi:alpha/beta fold hydrolase BchO [Ascidiaceihabitans sp.]|uniref:alpha/beta fold hydrolase BchO n=1 Tax=Ascidiaceihabitans sp. TaxID=1872644 RepID=UPI003297547F